MRHLVAALLALMPAAASGQAAPAPPAAATTQRLTDTLPVLGELYAERVAQFEREPVVTGRTIFLGNSITQGGDWARLTGDSTVVNRGIGGDVTFGVRRRLADVTRRRPSRLFILIGINDISRDVPDAVIAANYEAIVREVRAASPETRVYVQSVLPVNATVPGFPQHYDKGEHVRRVNARLRRIAAALGARYVDLTPLFADAHGRLAARYTGDGLHLNQLGYARWVRHLKAAGHL